jgi:hypothetical protein
MIFVTGAAFLLVGAGIAVAHGFDSKSVRAVSATFAATTASNVRTSSCTGADGTYAKSVATYTGTATSSEPSLNGNASIEAASFVNTTTGVGTVWGKLRIATADGRRTSAEFEGVLSHGSVVGLAAGRNHPHGDVKLVANFSADFSSAGGFANGKLGGGTAAGDAILIARGGCKPPKPPKPPKPEKVKARGAITAVSSSSITVAGVTCAVPANLQNDVAKVQAADVVTIECEVANGTSTLKHLSRHGHR